MGHKFRARGKTVKKMSRDGLMEQNLDRGKSVPASRTRRAGKTDVFSGSGECRNNKNAVDGRKQRRGILVERPDQSPAEEPDVVLIAEEKQPVLAEPDQSRPASRTLHVQPAYPDSFMDNGRRTDSGKEKRGNWQASDRRERQYISADSAVMINRKENSHESESSAGDSFRTGKCCGKTDHSLKTKACSREFSGTQGNSRENPDDFMPAGGRHSQDGNKKMTPCPLSGNENREEPAYGPADDCKDKWRNPVSDNRPSVRPSCMDNVRRQPSRGTVFVKAAVTVEIVRGRKIKNMPDSAGGRKRGRSYSVRKADGKGAWKKQEQDGSEPPFSTDVKKKELDMPEMSCSSVEESRRQQYFYHKRQDHVSGTPFGNTRDGKAAGALSDTFSGGHKEKIPEQQNGEGQKKQSGSRSFRKQDSRGAAKQEQDAPPLEKGIQMVRIRTGSRKQNQAGSGKRKKVRLSFDDENIGMVRGRDMGIAKRAVLMAAAGACAQSGRDDGQKQEDAAAYGVQKTARSAVRHTMRASLWRRQSVSARQRRQCASDSRIRRKSLRHGELLETGKKQPDQHGSEKARQKKKAEKKALQKRMIKKSYHPQNYGEPAAAPVPSVQAFILKAKQKTVKTVVERKGVSAAAAFLVLLAVIISAGMSSCGSILQGASSSIIGTTYISEDADIYAAEADYAALEDALDSQVNSMESAHPGYDEYRYQVDEISHDPYQLISCLTAAYGGFTYEQVKDMLPVLFDSQYRLTVEEIVEIRTETGAGTGEETEVEYEWHVLCICLTNRGIDGAAADFLTAEQAGRYAAYNAAKGNRDYLFDAESIPSGGADGDAQPGHGIPEDALSDVQFANMVREAEKYLGYPYVWGGSSPQTSFDCSGFVSWVINNCGNGWNVGRQTAEGLRGCCAYVPPADAKPGDLIFFQGTYNTAGASHVGIYVGNNRMVHCGNPVQYANTDTAYWQQHFLSFGRLP